MKEFTTSNNNESNALNKVLGASLQLPGSRVDRETFLRKELSKYCKEEEINMAISTTPKEANIPKEYINKIAKSCIELNTTKVAAISFATGLPGGWWMAAAIPADLAQFYHYIIVVAQKLAYLYGWPNLFDDDNEIDDETLLRLTLFIGVMMGSAQASNAITTISKKIAEQALRKLPSRALTKSGLYKIATQVAKWIGVRLTKSTFAKGVSKAVPIIGGVVSGSMSYVSFKIMANKLKKHLETLPLAN